MAMAAKARRWSNFFRTYTTMKKIFMALAAVAALVGCSKENTPMDVVAKNNVTVNASIVLDETRVSVEGENFTDVKWAEGDKIQLVSVAGTYMTMTADELSETRDQAYFSGEGSVAAAEDTYYAIYPAVAISEGVATINLAKQSGDDAAVWVAKASSKSAEEINMSFTPANALLHVTVSGVETLAKAEFKAFDGSALAQQFVYNFAEEVASTSGEVAAYAIETPANSFFFSLPADMDMTAGYVVSLTDAAGNVCSKAYNGKTFAKGTTTRVNIEWTLPSVSLGTPMTSYSYYAAGDPATANSCANNVIYSSASFSGIQKAMIAEAGYIINGKEYVAASVDAASKTIGNVTVSSWGEKSVQAYIKTKDGKEYKSSETATVHITGLPYSYNFVNGSLDAYRNAGWSTNGKLRVGTMDLASHSSTLVLHYYRKVLGTTNESGYIVSPMFNIPADINVQPQVVRHAYAAGVWNFKAFDKNGYVGPVSSASSSASKSITCTDKTNSNLSDSKAGAGVWLSAFTMTPSQQYVSVSCDTGVSGQGTYYFIYEVGLRYAE